MAGTVTGSIEHLITQTAANGARDHFVAWIKFFENSSAWTLVACQGNGATGTPDTWGWSGDANAPGDNSFCVYTNGTFHVLFQYSYGATFGSSPGNPADVHANYYNGIQMAFDTSGGQNIWNGGTGKAGADTKGTPVWVADGGTLIVYPRGNGSGGSFTTNKEACAHTCTTSSAVQRLSIVGDDDFIFWAWDTNNDGGYNVCGYMGPWTPATGVTPRGEPLVMMCEPGRIGDYESTGSTANSLPTDEGGIVAAVGEHQARSFKCPLHGGWFSTTQQPNGQRATPGYDLVDIPINVDDSQGAGSFGFLGWIELVQMAYNVPTHDTNPTLTKAFFGTGAQAERKWVVPWDGSTTPGTGATRDGVQF